MRRTNFTSDPGEIMLGNTRRHNVELIAAAILLLIISWLPYYWVIRTSLLSNIAAIQVNSPFIPILSEGFSLESFKVIWTRYNFVTYFKNSIIYALGSTAISLTVGIPGAYAFARLDFPGRKFLFYTAVLTLTIPFIVITIPVYEIFYNLGLLNTRIGVILGISVTVLPVVVWLLQGFFRKGIPQNIEEAAMIDGNTELGAFIYIVLPLSLPAIAAASLFAFLAGWNNFIWILVLAPDQRLHSATMAVHTIMATDVARDWAILMSAVSVLILPPIVFYGISQRYVGEGLGGIQ